MDFIENFINILLMIGLSVIIYFVKDFPKIYKEFKIEKFKSKSSMELQREAYFREIGGQEVYKVFEDWLSIIFDYERKMKNFNSQKAINLVSRTVIYGSTRTIDICSLYMQHIFINNEDKDNPDSSSYNSYKTMIYVSKIIASLKFDFTGYEIDALRLLEIKLNDYSNLKNEDLFIKAKKDIEKELSK